MAFSRVGTIEIHSRHGIIRLRCVLDGCELVVDRRAPRLFNDQTIGFYADHSHTEPPQERPGGRPRPLPASQAGELP